VPLRLASLRAVDLMKRFLLTLAGLLALVAITSQASAAPVVIDPARESIDLAGNLNFMKDTKRNIPVQDVLSGYYDNRFHSVPDKQPSFVALRHPLWAKITLRNPTTKPLQRLLVLKQTSLRGLTAYLPEGNKGNYRTRITSATQLLRDTDGRYPHFVYRLSLPPEENRTIYLRVDSHHVKFYLSLEEPSSYNDRIRMTTMLHSILFGFVLAVVAYQVALYLMARDPSYLSLVWFALCGMLYEFVKLGYHSMLLGQYSGLFSMSWGVIECLLSSAVVNFSRVFLHSRERFPRSDRALLVLQYGALVTAGIYVLDANTGIRLLQISVVIGAPMVLATAIRAVMAGVDHAGTYLAGWMPILIAGLYTAFSGAGLISIPAIEFMITPLGITLALFIFAFAVANRIGVERMERHALQSERSRLTGILDASPVAVLVIRDRDGHIAFANQHALAQFEGNTNSLKPGAMESLFGSPKEQHQLFEQVRQQGEIRDYELTMRGADARPFHGLLSMRPIQLDGEPHLIAWVYDISRRKEVEEQLLIAKQASDRANRAKSDFLAMISHEIRTPMNGILGMVQLLLRSSLSTRQRQQVETLHKSGRTLLTLLNDLLDFSRIEAGKLPLHLAPFSPREVVDKVVALEKQQAQEKGLSLNVKLDPRLPTALLGDSNRIRQVLMNLVNNALKFTDSGEVTVCMESTQVEAGRHRLSASVWDTGPGIPESFHKELFETFTRAPVQDAQQHQGSGLGLAICKRLIDAMGGTLTFKSTAGKGSRFNFTLELKEAELERVHTKEQQSEVEAIQAKDILVAEDLEANRQVIRDMLELGGHRVTLVHNGKEAVTATGQHCYDVILMDLQMPVMDGLEATRTIRAGSDGPSARTPIVAMTASLMEESIQSCRDAGMNHVLGKPIDLELLDDILRQLTTSGDNLSRVQSDTLSAGEELINAHTLQRLLEPLPESEQVDELLDKCRLTLEKARRNLLDALEGDQWEAIRSEAHQMKGIAGIYGFTRLAKEARRLDEWVLPAEEPRTQALPLVEALCLTLEQTLGALQEWPSCGCHSKKVLEYQK